MTSEFQVWLPRVWGQMKLHLKAQQRRWQEQAVFVTWHTLSCTHFYISQYISFLYITFYISQGSHHKLEGALSKSGHWFMFVYQHLTCVEILGCPALTEIRNSLKQDLSLKLLVKCVDEMTVHRGCLLARWSLILEPSPTLRTFLVNIKISWWYALKCISTLSASWMWLVWMMVVFTPFLKRLFIGFHF